MGWIGRLIEILLVTTHTCCWCVVVISLVTCRTIVSDNGMCSGQYIVIIVIGKCCRIPIRLGGVAGFTII